MSAPLDRMKALLNSAEMNAPRPSRLHAGTAIVDWFRAYRVEDPPMFCGAADGLLGVPVIPDPDLDDGEWRMLDQHGDLLRAGRVGEPGESIFYVPGQGFYAWKADLS